MLGILVILVFAGTFIVAAVAVLIAAAVQGRRIPKSEMDENQELTSDLPGLLRQDQTSTMPIWRQLLDHVNFTQFLKKRIDQAGMRWSVGRVTLSMLLLASLFFALFLDASWTPPGASLAAAWAGASVPYWIIEWKRKKRLRKIESQFPDALDSLARALRAGHALVSGITILALETAAPLGPEFRKLADEHRLGLSWAVALENLSRRVPILEVRLFVAAIKVQTRTGGKLTEVIERLGENIRETAALRGEVRAVSAQGRLTGTILTAMPIFIGLAMFFTNPSYIAVLFSDPTGRKLAWGAAGCILLGRFAIARIVEIKAPQ